MVIPGMPLFVNIFVMSTYWQTFVEENAYNCEITLATRLQHNVNID